MPSSTTLFSSSRRVQRARPLGGLEQAKAISLASFSPSKIRATAGVAKQEPPTEKIRGSAGRTCLDYFIGGISSQGRAT
jgi:hypothetical protein